MSVAAPDGGERGVTPWYLALVQEPKVHSFVVSPECALVAVNLLADVAGDGCGGVVDLLPETDRTGIQPITTLILIAVLQGELLLAARI